MLDKISQVGLHFRLLPMNQKNAARRTVVVCSLIAQGLQLEQSYGQWRNPYNCKV